MRLYSLAVPAAIAISTAIPILPALPPMTDPTSGIVADDDGTVYFADSFHRTVWRVQPDGRITEFVAGRDVKSLQMDRDGNVYGTHVEGRGRLVLWRADRDGNVVEIARCSVPDHPGHAFVMDDAGNIVGWDGLGRRTGVRVWRVAEGGVEHVAGGDQGLRDGRGAEAQFLPIGGMARAVDGSIYMTSGPTIRRLSPGGKVSTVISGERLLSARKGFLARLFGESTGHLTGIAIDENGTIFVANTARNTVIAVSRAGHVREVHTTDSGWTPTGVAVSGGVLYVLEYGPGVRVRRIDADGTAMLVAAVRANRSVVARAMFGDPLLLPS